MSTYNVYLDGVLKKSGLTTLSTTIAGLTPGTTYQVQVSASNASGESALSTPSTVTTASVAGTRINWNPGHYFVVGNTTHSNGITDNQTQAGIVLAQDTNNTVKGFLGVYNWDQLEGPTLGDYSKADAAIAPMIAWCKARNRTWSIAVNNTGNGGTIVSSFSVLPAYLNSTTYGPIDNNGNHGGAFYDATTPVLARFSNDATLARLTALGAYLYNTYGKSANPLDNIFCFMPMWSELSFQPPATTTGGLSTANILNAVSKPGGFFDNLRAAMPTTYLYVEATYLAFGNPGLMSSWFAATDRNHLTNGNFDSCNETGGVKQRANTGDPAFRGGQMSGGVFSPVAGLSDRVAGGQDFATHASEDTMNHRGNGPIPGTSTQGAWLGDGRLNITWQHDIEMGTSHKFWASNGTGQNSIQGPNCNRVRPQTSGTPAPPADYAESNPWKARGLVGFIDYIGPTPRQTYPASWPT